MNMEVYNTIKALADRHADELQRQVQRRELEMKTDDKSHFLIYNILGVSNEMGYLVDLYQNIGRFLYQYAGTFLEEAATVCFNYKYSNARKEKVPNTAGNSPKTFEIDCLVGNDAHELKWRDATTDGDHITKEHMRVLAVKEAGFTPIRVMFYYPLRSQAMRIQKTLETVYNSVGGRYYCGKGAWEYIKDYTGIDLFEILVTIAHSRQVKGYGI